MTLKEEEENGNRMDLCQERIRPVRSFIARTRRNTTLKRTLSEPLAAELIETNQIIPSTPCSKETETDTPRMVNLSIADVLRNELVAAATCHEKHSSRSRAARPASRGIPAAQQPGIDSPGTSGAESCVCVSNEKRRSFSMPEGVPQNVATYRNER